MNRTLVLGRNALGTRVSVPAVGKSDVHALCWMTWRLL